MRQSISSVEDNAVVAFIKRLSWSAVFAGVVIAIAVELLLSLLGLGIGLGSINPVEQSQPLKGLGISSVIWWLLSMLIALFIGGWVSGWIAGIPHKTDRALHGILTWCLFALINMYFVTTTVGNVIGGVGTVIGKGLSVAGEGIKSIAPEAGNMVKENIGWDDNTMRDLQKEAETLLKQTGKKELQPGKLKKKAGNIKDNLEETAQSVLENPQTADSQIDSLFKKLFRSGDATFAAADRDALVNIIVKRSGKSKAAAEQIVDNWIATANEVKAKAKEAKDKAIETAKETGHEVAAALSKFALFSFLGLILGAVSAAIGSVVALRHNDNEAEMHRV
jgi:hypothetical protein